MAHKLHQKNIITDGLVYGYDPANVRSYPGSGTVLTNLVPDAPVGALINGVGFDGKGFTFDGIDDQIQTSINFGTTYTFSMWLKFDVVGDIAAGEASGRYIFRVGALTSVTANRAGSPQTWFVPAMTTGTWYNFTSVRNNTNDEELFINGVSQGTKTFTSNPDFIIFNIGNFTGAPGSFNWDGCIGEILGYNAAFSGAQVLHNFEALQRKYI